MIASDFDQFVRDVHGHAPFPWQSAVVEDILRDGTWPSSVDVPTGLGKTTMLDVAVFVLALSAGGEAPRDLGRRRIFFVVDRCLVVDQAEAHARRIAAALADAAPGTIGAEIAGRLRSLSTSSSPDVLHVVKMRGGVTWDAAWLPRPDLPAIVTGTVDQVGSRLFFRGYGVSTGRRPIDAALVGTDSVVLVDEAHLAQALTASLDAARSFDAPTQRVLPTSVTHLSATHAGIHDGWVTAFDEQAHLDHPVARPRLTAPKSLRLIDTSKDKAVAEMVAQAVASSAAETSRVLVVCNTVDRARAVHEQLGQKLPGAELLLLMGRSRSVDREVIARRAIELFDAGRGSNDGAAVLVATQTVEVGIDLDATALITETASWDALVQRVGRVNRRGVRDSASVVVVEDNDPKPPVYRQAKLATASFLRERLATSGALDVSPLALRKIAPPPDASSPPPLLPVLFPAQLDAWVRTSPAPATDPPLDPYLHGIDRALAPVLVAWRSGLVDDLDDQLPSAALAVDSVPLRAEEFVEIPLPALRSWLRNERESVPIGDWDDWDDDIAFKDGPEGTVLRRADDGASWEWIADDQLRPGDAVVVPSERGGLDRFGWAPGSTEPVPDVSELVSTRRGQPALRLDRDLPMRLGLPDVPELWDLVMDWRNSEDPEGREEFARLIVDTTRAWLERHSEPMTSTVWTATDLARLCSAFDSGAQLVLTDKDAGPVLRTTAPEHSWQTADETTPEGSSTLERRVTLAKHLDAVGERAARIAEALGLPEMLRRSVVDAARWHDLGKVDIRFQAMLFGGSRISAELATEPLAKSGMRAGDQLQHRQARRLSGLPRGARHEAWSEELVRGYLGALDAPYPGDSELLCHLVASHHGHARPFLPPVEDRGRHELAASVDGRQVTVTLPAGVKVSDADRFATLNARYGRWGLALLETIVRCADMTVSAEGS